MLIRYNDIREYTLQQVKCLSNPTKVMTELINMVSYYDRSLTSAEGLKKSELLDCFTQQLNSTKLTETGLKVIVEVVVGKRDEHFLQEYFGCIPMDTL